MQDRTLSPDAGQHAPGCWCSDCHKPIGEFAIGDRVYVVGSMTRYSRVVELRTSRAGAPIIVLADGGWMTPSEIVRKGGAS